MKGKARPELIEVRRDKEVWYALTDSMTDRMTWKAEMGYIEFFFAAAASGPPGLFSLVPGPAYKSMYLVPTPVIGFLIT